ncbi:MAG: glycosyltransferase family 25 protein [Candidatus Riflemargulisbacteria bacterium]
MNEIPKVFVIALKELAERRNAAKTHLEALGLKPTLFSGLYGRDVGLISSRSQNDNIYRRLTPNGLCLSLNHWFLWQHIVMAEIPQAIIFEDDILLPDNFKEFFDESMANTPTDWDMVYMSILFPDRIDDGRIRAVKVAGNVWRHIEANTWDGACDGLHAYMVTLEGAKKMIDVPLTLDEPMDRWMSFHILPYLKTFIWYPSPIVQRSWETTRYEQVN